MKKGFLGELEKEIQKEQPENKEEFLNLVNKIRVQRHNASPLTINSAIIETWINVLGLTFEPIHKNWIDLKLFEKKQKYYGPASTMELEYIEDLHSHGNSEKHTIKFYGGNACCFDIKKEDDGIELTIYGEWEFNEILAFFKELKK